MQKVERIDADCEEFCGLFHAVPRGVQTEHADRTVPHDVAVRNRTAVRTVALEGGEQFRKAIFLQQLIGVMPEQHPVAEGIALPRGGILQLRGQPFHENLPVFRRNRLPGRGEQRGRVAKYHLQRLPEEFPLLLRRKLLPVVQ